MLRTMSCVILALPFAATSVSAQVERPLLVGMGDSIGEGVQSADASYFTQPFSYLSVLGWRSGAWFPLPWIVTSPFSMVGSTTLRYRLDSATEGMNLAVSGADVNSLLYDRADGITDSETDLVLSPRLGSQMEIAESLRPVYVACWIGNNDALGAVTSFDLLDGSQLTSVADFTRDFTAIADRLQAADSKVVFATIPNVSQIGLLLSRDDIVALSGWDFGVAPADQTTIITVLMIALHLLPPDVLLDQNYILSADEASLINTRIADFNAVIRSVAAARGMGVADINARFADFIANPPTFMGVPLTNKYLGGLFSLDGVHPSNITNVLVANEFINVLQHPIRRQLLPG
jgi:hypothetical protein